MNQFRVDEFANTKKGQLTAVARFFHAAKGQVLLAASGLVDKNHSGFDLLGDQFTQTPGEGVPLLYFCCCTRSRCHQCGRGSIRQKRYFLEHHFLP